MTTSLQPEWQDDALYGRLPSHPLDAPTFIAAGYMWQAVTEDHHILPITGMILINRRIA